MANIILIGFPRPESEKLRDQIDTIVAEKGWATPGESATVILESETRWCDSKKPAPYLVVQHSKAHMAEAIGTALHDALNLDTQIEVSHKYLASVPDSLLVITHERVYGKGVEDDGCRDCD